LLPRTSNSVGVGRLFVWLYRSVWLCLGLSVSIAAHAQQADAIYYNGKITTVWDQHPSAQALAIAGDRFLAVGTNDEVLKNAGPKARKIDLHEHSVLPGLIDGHVHPITAALSEIEGPVSVFRSVREIQTYIRDRAGKQAAGQVIFVPKVFATRLAEHRYPTLAEVDEAAGNHDAIVDNGYAAVLSSSLLKRLGIPAQRISRFEALKMWTLNNAYLMFAEKDLGSIQPGKLADMVIIAEDFANCPDDNIKDIEPLETIVGGRTVYDRAQHKAVSRKLIAPRDDPTTPLASRVEHSACPVRTT